MKIGILTLIGEYNYGNLLQSYALQTVLQRLGHEVVVLNRRGKAPTIQLQCIRILSYVKSWFSRYVLGNKERLIVNPLAEDYNPKSYCDKSELQRFAKEYIVRTNPLRSTQAMQNYFEKVALDTLVVGSDQVWREECVYSIEEMFLSFIPNESHAKRIAYAASFGTDENFISSEKISTCIELLKRFEAVSVREESGIKICGDQFGVTAWHVLDPTMLLSTEDYRKIVGQYPAALKSNGDLLCYVLDENDILTNAIESFAAQNKLTPFSVYKIELNGNKKCRYQLPSIEQWLKGFDETKYVITDSFHATVFSILFHKPFICVGNKYRGMSRFHSLLKMFGLENRLVDVNHLNELNLTEIDWDSVDEILFRKRKESMAFIVDSLNISPSLIGIHKNRKLKKNT